MNKKRVYTLLIILGVLVLAVLFYVSIPHIANAATRPVKSFNKEITAISCESDDIPYVEAYGNIYKGKKVISLFDLCEKKHKTYYDTLCIYDGEYENKIGTLYKLKHQSHPQFEPDEENILFSLLKFAENSKLLVSLEDEENSVTGFLKSFSDTQIELETVNDYGKYSGVTVIDLEMVETISVDTDYEQDVKLLADNNTENGYGC